MRTFLLYLTSLTILIAATYGLVPLLFGVTYPKTAGPAFEPSVRTLYQQQIDRTRPRVVLIGDSTAYQNVNPEALSAAFGSQVYDISLPGMASTLWYLIIKNNIITARHKPGYLIILFRDSMLTTPDFRVQGSYFQQIDEFAGPNDELLIQRAFVNKMSWPEKLAEQYLPPYGSRMQFRGALDGLLRKTLPGLLLKCDTSCVDSSLSGVFRSDRFESKIMGDAINSADDYLYIRSNLDFRHRVDQSFLPNILRLCRENNIQLILVNSRSYRFTPRTPAPPELKTYLTDLARYADQNGILLLDFSGDDRLGPDLYADPIHLNKTGRETFTGMLAQSLAPIIH